VNWLRRLTPPVRLGLVVVSLVALLLLVRFLAGPDENRPLADVTEFAPPSEVARPEPVALQTVARPMGLDALGAPDDPLPPAPPIADPIQSDEAEDTLARQVLAGSPESLSALVVALQMSGIGILGPADSSDIKPAEPWQGMVMRRWEVRAAAAMVLPERTVVFTLPDLAAVLTEAIPELKGAPVEQLIVKDLRALAESPVPTRRFFGRFIAALGRNASSHAPYDLLTTVDLQTIRLNGLQASLILRRLAVDILMQTADAKARSNDVETKTDSLLATLGGWLAPTIHAQGAPCRVSERTQTIMDIAGLGSSLVWGGLEIGQFGMSGLMERLRLARYGRAAAIASTVLAYAQFIAAYAALTAEVTMDAARLVRTKDRTAGELRQLTGVVRFDAGNAEMLNCLRALFIAIGFDFSLPNNGPIKGARVSWEPVHGFSESAPVLHGASEPIVQFASSGSQRVMDAVTGDDGKVQIGVQGRPQTRTIGNDATEVPKSATVRLQVALKGADLFGDVQEAAGTAAGGLVALATVPLSVLSRAQWASVGHFSFPVIDWRDGPQRWAGSITYTKVTAWSESSTGKATRLSQDYREALTLNITITETLEGSAAFGGGAAMLQGTARANYTMRNARSGSRLTQCSGGSRPIHDLTSTQIDTGEGSGAGTARATVGVSADGQYSVTISPDVTITTRTEASSQQLVIRGECQVETQSTPSPPSSGSLHVSDSMQGDGTIDPKIPNRLTGRTEEKEGHTTRTLTWDLQRQ
jgi:hypothetical protein